MAQKRLAPDFDTAFTALCKIFLIPSDDPPSKLHTAKFIETIHKALHPDTHAEIQRTVLERSNLLPPAGSPTICAIFTANIRGCHVLLPDYLRLADSILNNSFSPAPGPTATCTSRRPSRSSTRSPRTGGTMGTWN